jgi:hypothetical protein
MRASIMLVDESKKVAIRKIITTARVRKGTGLILAANGGNYDPRSGCLISSFHPPKGPAALLLCVFDDTGKVTHDFRQDPYLKKLMSTLPKTKLTRQRQAVK